MNRRESEHAVMITSLYAGEIAGRIVKGCVREVSLAQVSCILMYVYVARPHQWVRGRWPWGYGSVLSIIIIIRQRFEYYYY